MSAHRYLTFLEVKKNNIITKNYLTLSVGNPQINVIVKMANSRTTYHSVLIEHCETVAELKRRYLIKLDDRNKNWNNNSFFFNRKVLKDEETLLGLGINYNTIITALYSSRSR